MKVWAKKSLRETRIVKGLTIVEVAKMVGITKQMMGQIELGINGVGPANAKKITDVLGVNFDDVFELVERVVSNGASE